MAEQKLGNVPRPADVRQRVSARCYTILYDNNDIIISSNNIIYRRHNRGTDTRRFREHGTTKDSKYQTLATCDRNKLASGAHSSGRSMPMRRPVSYAQQRLTLRMV